MQRQPWMKACLLLLAIAGTVVATGGSAQARHWRGGYYGGWGGGWGGYGGYGWYGGYPYNGYAYNYPNYGYSYGYSPYNSGNAYVSNYAPSAQPMNANQVPAYSQGGCNSTTAAYPPSGPMPGTPGGYNGTTYEGGPPTPTYAPGAMGQPGNAGQQNAAPPPPGTAAAPSPSTTSGAANQPNATPASGGGT